jgi:hypothetical protein
VSLLFACSNFSLTYPTGLIDELLTAFGDQRGQVRGLVAGAMSMEVEEPLVSDNSNSVKKIL